MQKKRPVAWLLSLLKPGYWWIIILLLLLGIATWIWFEKKITQIEIQIEKMDN